MSKFEIKDGVLVRYNAPFPLKEKEDYTLVIPEGVKKIEENLFINTKCTKLVLPKSLEVIGSAAFFSGPLKEIEGGENVDTIGEMAFCDCNLKSVDNFKNLRIIKAKAFSENKLTNLKFGEKLEFIGEMAFSWNNIEKLDLGDAKYLKVSASSFKGNKIKEFIPQQDGATLNGAFSYNDLNEEDYVYRDTTLYTPQAFLYAYTKIPEVITPEKSDGWTIEDFNLKKGSIVSLSEKGRLKLSETDNLTVPYFKGFKTIGKDFLKNAPVVQNIYINEGYTKINTGAFYDMDIEYIRLPETLESIGDCAFAFSKLKGVKIPSKVKNIGKMAFGDSNIEYLDMSDCKVKVIKGKMCLECHNLKTVKLPKALTDISEGAFMECQSLRTIEFPSTLKQIGDGAFSHSGLREVKFGKDNQITHIGKMAFYKCNNLTDFNFSYIKNPTKNPANFVEIENYAFYGTDLKSVTINESVFIAMRVFEKSSIEEAKIYTSFIGDYAFKDNQIKNLTLKCVSMTIKESAFLNNDIESLTVECDSLKLDKEVFRNNNIKSVKIENLEEMYDNAFIGNPIEELEIPEDTEIIRSERDEE